MRFIPITLAALFSTVSSTIFQNGQVRPTNYPDTSIARVKDDSSWKTYPPNATEISYKGRWDSKHISWWSAPGLRFAFSGDKVAISFGNWTDQGTLIGYRLDGQDWMFTNVTANSTHQLISSSTAGFNLTSDSTRRFELRVTNWNYGVQIDSVHVSSSGKLIKVPDFSRNIEVIGDSLSAGQYATYEGLSSYAWDLCAGFGDVEFSITARPGICLVDQNCWGNPRGQTYQWFRTPDTSDRAYKIWGDNPEPWPFHKHQAADIVVINLGTNDNNTHNNVSNSDYYNSYISFVGEVHRIWPGAQIILMSLWNGFGARGSSYYEVGAFKEEIWNVYRHYEHTGFVHYFNTTGIMQHNDIAPQWHPTDFGHVKVASHLMQYIKLKFGWELGASGPEVQHDTLYWNDEPNY